MLPEDHPTKLVHRWTDVVHRTSFPAYPIQGAEMRPVTKITIFGMRLGIAVLAVYWAAIFVGTHLPGMTVVQFAVHDKIKHFSAFFVLGALMCYITNSQRWFLRFGAIGLVGMTYAAIDELTQHLVPGRFPDVMDFAADAAGLWTAIALYLAAKCLLGDRLALDSD